MTFNIGENVGAYRIVEQLGQGGMAMVYKAYHASLDRYVAIKVLHAAFKEDPTFLARFQREARVVARLEYPNIVPVYDFAEHNGSPYLVMKFIEGETLKARLTRGPLLLSEMRKIVESVGAGLEYAHKQGILHRDIKPSNVMMANDGSIYIADFGLARIALAGESTLSADSMLGTPHYMSPEQAKGAKELDAGTDIYSFGVVLYELMVGRVPYNADTPFAIIHDHIFTPLPLPHIVNPNVPEAVERVLLKALAKERADRYPDVAALVKAFMDATAEAAAAEMASPSEAETVVSSPSAAEPTHVAAGAAVTAAAPAKTVAASSTKKKGLPWGVWVGVAVALVLCAAAVFIFSRIRANRVQQAQNTAQAALTPASTPPPTPGPGLALPPGVFYQENFDGGQAPGWVLDPAWTVQDNALCGKGHGFARYAHGNWPDYYEEFRLRLDKGTFHANYRFNENPMRRYFIEFFDDGHFQLSKQDGDKFIDLPAKGKYPYKPGEWLTIGVGGLEGHLQVFVNKVMILDFVDREPIKAGGISFETLDNSAACVDDVTVTEWKSAPPPADGKTPSANDSGSPMDNARKAFESKDPDQGFAFLGEAISLDPSNPKAYLTAGDMALSYGPEYSQRALEFYLPAKELEDKQKDDLARPILNHTALAMYMLAGSSGVGCDAYLKPLIDTFQPQDMVRLAHDRCLILTLKDQFPGVEKDFKALLQSQPNNWMVNLIRGDMYFKLRRLKDAEVDYLLVIQKGIGTLPDWAIAEARCKAEQIRQTPLKARLEITCEPPASLVNGK